MKLSSTPTLQSIRRFRHAHRARTALLEAAILLCTVMLISSLFLRNVPLSTGRAFALGSVGSPTARNFQQAETTATGQSFRWTDGDSTLVLPPQSIGPHTLRLTIAAPRPIESSVPLTITVNGHLALSLAQPAASRQYALIVPPDWVRLTSNEVRIQSDVFAPPQDSAHRTLGVVVFDAEWQGWNRSAWLVPAQTLAIALTSSLVYLLLVAAGLSVWPRLLIAVLFVAIALAMRHSDTRFVYRWNALLVTLVLGVALAITLALIGWRPTEATSLRLSRWSRLHRRAFAGYVVVTGVMLLPLLLRFATHIYGFPGDNYEYLWKIQWFSEALLDRHVSPVFAPQIFYPTGADLTISEITPANTLLGVPVTWLFGPIATYNAVVAGSFLLTAFFTYLLANRLGATRGAAWVAGLIFAFCLRRYFHATGHLGMMGTQWLALTLYGWEGALTRRRMWDGYVAGLGFALATWSSLHYGTTLPVMLACYTLVRLGVRGLPGLLSAWRPLLLTGAITFTLIVPLAQPYVEARQQGETYQHQYAQVLLSSAMPREYLLPNPYHPVWGNWASQLYPADGGEHGVAPGYVALALALGAAWLGRRQSQVQALLVLILINVVLSFGPELRFADGRSLSLPARFIYAHVPVLGNIRNWSRMAMYVALCVALLAALALTALPQRWYRVGWLVAALLVLVESASVLPLNAPRPRAVDLWLRGQPDAGAVANLPDGSGGLSMYYSLFNGKPTNQGQGKFPPSLYREGRNILDGFPKESALRLMQRWQTEYIVVDEAAMARKTPDWSSRLASQTLVTEVYRNDGYSVYRLKR